METPTPPNRQSLKALEKRTLRAPAVKGNNVFPMETLTPPNRQSLKALEKRTFRAPAVKGRKIRGE